MAVRAVEGHPRVVAAATLPPMTAMRLASIATRGVPGLPDIDLALQPVTALIGPRASGKSSLLRAVSWLLTGMPPSVGQVPVPTVRAELLATGGGQRRKIERGASLEPESPLPQVVFLAAHDR